MDRLCVPYCHSCLEDYRGRVLNCGAKAGMLLLILKLILIIATCRRYCRHCRNGVDSENKQNKKKRFGGYGMKHCSAEPCYIYSAVIQPDCGDGAG